MIGDEVHLLLGAYVLGGLSSEDRRAFERHLPGCERCRTELAEVAGLPGLLRRGDMVPPIMDDPVQDAGLGTVLARARHKRVVSRRIRVAVAAVAACAIGATAAVELAGGHHDAPSAAREAVIAGPGNHMLGRVSLTGKAWGTSLEIDLSGMPHSGTFTLEATDDRGRVEPACTWSGTDTGAMDVVGATSIPISDLRALRVIGPGDEVLASADV